jgi:uncharacterized protein (TIGR02217 family)
LSATFHEIQLPCNHDWEPRGGPGYKTNLGALDSGREQTDEDWPNQRAQYEVTYTLRSAAQLKTLLTFLYVRRGSGYGFRLKDWLDYKVANSPFGGTGPTFEGNFGLAVNTTIASVQRRFNKATLITDALNSNVSKGQPLVIADCPDTSFNGSLKVLKQVNANTFTFASAGTDTGVIEGGSLTGNPYQLGKVYQDDGGGRMRKISKPCSGLVTDASGHTPPVPVIFVDGAPQVVTTDYAIDVTTGLVTFTAGDGAGPPHGSELTWVGEFDVPVRFDADYLEFEIRSFNDVSWPSVKMIELIL